jgi:hypothetical protein
MQEDCALCGMTFPRHSLIRCPRCGRMYCRNCVIFSWNRNVLRNVPTCLNCARKLVSPRSTRKIGKYSPLGSYLTRRQQPISYVTLSFAEIEKIIGDKLPFSAFEHQHWWSNTVSRAQAKAWLNAGWIVHDVNLNDKTVIFKRVREPDVKIDREREKGAAVSTKKTFQPPKPRKPRRRIPSKTKMAMTMARLKNVERRKRSMKKYRGKFKPKSAFEKRLYRSEETPDKQD